MKLKKLFFNILIVIACLAFYKGIGILINNCLPLNGISEIKKDFIKELLGVVAAIIGLIVLKKKHVLGFKLEGFREGLKTGAAMLALSGLLLLTFIFKHDSITASVLDIILFAVFTIMIGIYEEVLFRGIFQNAFHEFFGEDSKKNVIKAVVVSSTIFGLCHFLNLLSGGNILSVTIQALSAIAAGIIFGAVYCNSGKNIWPCVLIHGFVDGCSFLHSGILSGKTVMDAINEYSIINVISIVLFLSIAIYLLVNMSMSVSTNHYLSRIKKNSIIR